MELDKLILILFGFFVLVLAVGGIVFYTWAMATYGNTPVGEVPLWIAWLLFD